MKITHDTRFASWLEKLAKASSNPEIGIEAENEYLSLRMHIGGHPAETVVANLSRARGPEKLNDLPVADCLPAMISLRELAFGKSAKALWAFTLPHLEVVPAEQWLRAAPDGTCLEEGRKDVCVSKSEFSKRLAREPTLALETAGADWLLAHGTSKDIEVMLRILLENRPRPRGLTPSADLLTGFLKKDPKGKKLMCALRAAGEDEGRLSRLVAVARDEVLRAVPSLAQQESAEVSITRLIKALFGSPPLAQKDSLRSQAGELAVLGGRLLQIARPSPGIEATLMEIARIGGEIRQAGLDAGHVSNLWILESAESPAPSVGQTFNSAGARQWAIVYERATLDGHPLGYLETLGRNLGLREIARPGSVAAYLPQRHQDTEGGIIPGDGVELVSSGWRLDDFIAIRAKVRRAKAKP